MSPHRTAQTKPLAEKRGAGAVGFPRAWAVVRLCLAVLVIAATFEQARLAAHVAELAGIDPAFAIGRLFTFFTVLSNVSLAVVLVVVGIRTLKRGDERTTDGLTVMLASVTTYMLVTGLVYNVVLRSAGDDVMGGWSNEVHHVIAPVFVLVDALFGPRRRALRWRSALWGLVFPLVWVGFTLVTGPYRSAIATGKPPWYPYPFLDPAQSGGYGGVAIWVAGITVVFVVLMLVVVGIGRYREARAFARGGGEGAPSDGGRG